MASKKNYHCPICNAVTVPGFAGIVQRCPNNCHRDNSDLFVTEWMARS